MIRRGPIALGAVAMSIVLPALLTACPDNDKAKAEPAKAPASAAAAPAQSASAPAAKDTGGW